MWGDTFWRTDVALCPLSLPHLPFTSAETTTKRTVRYSLCQLFRRLSIFHCSGRSLSARVEQRERAEERVALNTAEGDILETMPSRSAADFPVREFGPESGWALVNFPELWNYRELGWVLAKRDFQVRYRQALIGMAWAIVQPLATVLIFDVLFRLIQARPTQQQLPFVVVSLCGILPWQLFATTLRDASDSLVGNRELVTKTYFPRLILPISVMLTSIVDFLIGCVVLAVVCWIYGVVPSGNIVFLPAFFFLAAVTALAGGIWFSALNALYRDIHYIVPFLLQIGLYMSPALYQSEVVIPERWQWLYALNPMVVVIEGFRWSVLGTEPPQLGMMIFSTVSALALWLPGLYFFKRVERVVADQI